MTERITWKLSLILTVFSWTCWLESDAAKPWNVEDKMSFKDKMKLLNITMELMADANLKIRHTLDIREKYSHTTAFEVGVIIGKIREKYRHMIEAYRQIRDKYTERTVNRPPALRDLKPIHYIVTMELVWLLQREIGKLVDVLETTVDLTAKLRTKKPNPLDEKEAVTHAEEAKSKKRSLRDEQQLKRRYRQQYLMRRLSLPANTTTTRKRFIDQWPVEETWSFGPYDDMDNK